MAKSVDIYADLEELGIDCENTEVDEQFTKAANHLQTLLPNVNNQILLNLYGYYKQATEGPCNVPKPSWYDMKAKSKWESWNKLGELSKTEAKMLYIKEIQQLDQNFNCFGNNTTSVKETWVTVSTLQKEDDTLNESDKSVTDYVKDNDYEQVKNILRSYDTDKLNNVINNLDDEGLGLIHWAADRGSVQILQVLLDYGSDINLTDSEQQTALHYASSCGHVECVKFLLNNKADINVKDADGLDPVSVASDDAIKNLLVSFK